MYTYAGNSRITGDVRIHETLKASAGINASPDLLAA